LKLTTDRNEESRGLFATAELLVISVMVRFSRSTATSGDIVTLDVSTVVVTRDYIGRTVTHPLADSCHACSPLIKCDGYQSACGRAGLDRHRVVVSYRNERVKIDVNTVKSQSAT